MSNQTNSQKNLIARICEPLLEAGMPRAEYSELVDITDHAIEEMVKTLGRVTDTSSTPFIQAQSTVLAAKLAAERLTWVADRCKEAADLIASGVNDEASLDAIITNAPNIGARH